MRDKLAEVGVPGRDQRRGQRVRHPSRPSDWLRLLEAIERPSSTLRAHACALTPFLGWSAERVASASEEEWERIHARLHRWAQVLRLEGVASLSERITLVEGLPGRVLGEAGGERELTDLRHVGQLLHAAARAEALGPGRADRVAAPPDRGRRAGDRRRGAQPPPGVRRRGRAGPDHPPQQGPRVPRRLLPVPVGAVPGAQGRAGHVPRPRRLGRADRRRRARGRGLPAPRRSSTRRRSGARSCASPTSR